MSSLLWCDSFNTKQSLNPADNRHWERETNILVQRIENNYNCPRNNDNNCLSLTESSWIRKISTTDGYYNVILSFDANFMDNNGMLLFEYTCYNDRHNIGFMSTYGNTNITLPLECWNKRKIELKFDFISSNSTVYMDNICLYGNKYQNNMHLLDNPSICDDITGEQYSYNYSQITNENCHLNCLENNDCQMIYYNNERKTCFLYDQMYANIYIVSEYITKTHITTDVISGQLIIQVIILALKLVKKDVIMYQIG